MLKATRRAEELIEPQLQLAVVNAESDVFTLNTKPSDPQASLVKGATVETWSQGFADDLHLPEQVAGGKTKGEMHRLEHCLLELYNLHGDKDHPDIAATLHALGKLSQSVGDLPKAKQHLEESLRINRGVHGDKDHPDIAATLSATFQWYCACWVFVSGA